MGYYDSIYKRKKGIQSKWHHIHYNLVKRILGNYKKHLDVGCGGGTFINFLDKKKISHGVDISDNQINYAKKNYQTNKHKLFLIKNNILPFKSNTFDIVTNLQLIEHLSIKDNKELIREIHRVLKKDGRFVIVDLGKPDEAFIRAGVSFYLRCILPILAFIAGGRLGLKFGKLYGTYKRWPQNKKLEGLLLEKFSRVEFEKDLMGGAIMVAAFK